MKKKTNCLTTNYPFFIPCSSDALTEQEAIEILNRNRSSLQERGMFDL